ncbi:hypothetical protein CL655_00520 [bacterium]|nr:hypothetical protein [bacterium]|tara:strand:+ start:179 stop:682 length:504 start_codon:yes stop_codon:yes gene_type:complete
MKREYWMRVAVVWLLLLGGLVVVAAVLTAPSFVLVESQLRAYESQIQTAAAVASEQRALTEEVTRANQLADTVYSVGTIPKVYPYLNRIAELQGEAVMLTRFSVTRVETAVASINVAGVAATRQSLTNFSDAVVADPLFTAADVPLSNLANNEDIAFSISIVVAEPE